MSLWWIPAGRPCVSGSAKTTTTVNLATALARETPPGGAQITTRPSTSAVLDDSVVSSAADAIEVGAMAPPLTPADPSPATSIHDDDEHADGLEEQSVGAVVVRRIEAPRKYLTDVGVDNLVADYLAGAGIGELARWYGIHRGTLTAHLRRRNMPQRQAGLNREQRTEAARLYRKGQSLRAIGRRMGVDRKAVRAALVEADLIREGMG